LLRKNTGRCWNVTVVEPDDRIEAILKILASAKCTVKLGRPRSEAGNRYAENELINLCQKMDGVIVNSRDRYTSNFFASLPELRVLSKVGRGVERIDLKAATEKGVLVTHTPNRENYLAMAEATIALMLALAKQLKAKMEYARVGHWTMGSGTMLWGKTVGIIGFGRIGSRVAYLLSHWGCRILAYSPTTPREKFDLTEAEPVTLERLLRESDFVTIHIDIRKDNQALIGERELRMMKETAYLINTSRGLALDEEALIRALREKRIAGAALDVFEPEPPAKNNPLITGEFGDNVIITPHSIGTTKEQVRLAEVSAENVVKALNGIVPEHVANPEVIPAWIERTRKLDAKRP